MMKREQVEQYLEQQVQVTLFDDSFYEGIILRCDDKRFETNPSLFLKPKYYVLISNQGTIVSPIFRCSHIRKLTIC